MYTMIIVIVPYYSDDNENTAHSPDAFNSKWYIQTPAQRINVATSNVS